MEFTLLHAAVRDWRNVPDGWNITIDNDPSWRLHFVAQGVVFSNFLDPGEFGPISLQPEPGFSCDALAQATPQLHLDFEGYGDDRMHHRTVPAVITGP